MQAGRAWLVRCSRRRTRADRLGGYDSGVEPTARADSMTRTTASSLMRWRASGLSARETVEILTCACAATSRIVTREAGFVRAGLFIARIL